MKLDSKYFDSIRVKRDPVEGLEESGPACQWKGCTGAGLYRAPKGRGREGQYWCFCLDHVRHYNSEYNYFEGMTNLEIEEFQKDALTGHRPTWRVGTTGAAWDPGRMRMADPHGALAWRLRRRSPPPEVEEDRRPLKPLERKSLAALGLDRDVGKAGIKARFKALVKLHHPDSNGGDKRSEEKLREILQAYTYLKQAGLV